MGVKKLLKYVDRKANAVSVVTIAAVAFGTAVFTNYAAVWNTVIAIGDWLANSATGLWVANFINSNIKAICIVIAVSLLLRATLSIIRICSHRVDRKGKSFSAISLAAVVIFCAIAIKYYNWIVSFIISNAIAGIVLAALLSLCFIISLIKAIKLILAIIEAARASGGAAAAGGAAGEDSGEAYPRKKETDEDVYKKRIRALEYAVAETKKSFAFSWVFASVGLLFFVFAVVWAIVTQQYTVSYMSVAGGMMIELFQGTALVLRSQSLALLREQQKLALEARQMELQAQQKELQARYELIASMRAGPREDIAREELRRKDS